MRAKDHGLNKHQFDRISGTMASVFECEKDEVLCHIFEVKRHHFQGSTFARGIIVVPKGSIDKDGVLLGFVTTQGKLQRLKRRSRVARMVLTPFCERANVWFKQDSMHDWEQQIEWRRPQCERGPDSGKNKSGSRASREPWTPKEGRPVTDGFRAV